jgi:hypothetical protein
MVVQSPVWSGGNRSNPQRRVTAVRLLLRFNNVSHSSPSDNGNCGNRVTV